MKYLTKRVVSFRETGTSTEDRWRRPWIGWMMFAGSVPPGMQNQGTRWDFNYGRGNDWWEPDKDYEVNPAKL